MTYTITITSRPCKKTDDLLALLPTIEKAYPAVRVEVDVKDENCQGDRFPQTRVIWDGRVQALLYGFRTESQHMMFLSSVLDCEWGCRLAS